MAKQDKSNPSKAKDQFCFRRLDVIGRADAEEDELFLLDCFVDVGYLDCVKDLSDPRSILLGRTGSGKTALIRLLQEQEERVVVIPPESLALSHISNSTVLGFFLELGIDIDIFFRLLWKHVFIVEIIREHLGQSSEEVRKNRLDGFFALFRSKRDQQALEYLRTWGSHFWEETDYRIREFTSKLETDLIATIGTGFPAIPLSVDAAKRMSSEQKGEVVNRAQHVVNQVQLKNLTYIMRKLNDLLDDPQKRYYIVIDKLDEDWVEDRLRFLLIRALIEVCREFGKIAQFKILVAIRLDLLERVIRQTRDSGFQEEKYESLHLNIEWGRDQLINVLDSRVRRLVKQRYTKKPVSAIDLLPRAVEKQDPFDYMLDRTMMRPRDLILFFNRCIAQAAGTPQITATMIKTAEGEYSRARLKALADEWYADYPNFMGFVELLKGRPAEFDISSIEELDVSEFCLQLVCEGFRTEDDLSRAAKRVAEAEEKPSSFLRAYFKTLYKVGLVGLKLEAHEGTVWSIDGRRSVSVSEIKPSTRISIHPCAWRTFGTQPVGKPKGRRAG